MTKEIEKDKDYGINCPKGGYHDEVYEYGWTLIFERMRCKKCGRKRGLYD